MLKGKKAKKPQATLKRPRNNYEEQLQIQAVAWFHRQYPKYHKLFYHPANGGKRGKATAIKLKLMGVRRGVPDIILDVTSKIDGTSYPGLRIELKPDKKLVKSYPSKEQREVIEAMKDQGYYATVCYGLEEFQKVVNWYLRPKKLNKVYDWDPEKEKLTVVFGGRSGNQDYNGESGGGVAQWER